MKIKVFGLPVIPKSLPTKLIPYDNFKNAKIDNVRTLTFSEGGTDDNPTFLLDGKEFNPNVVNQVMTLGTTEEWHLVNETSETHPFHIHINPFQVISINGIPVDRKSLDDTFPIPAHGEVVMRTKYRDFDGKYVLHCHILFHEDHGMMQVVEVVKPNAIPAPDNGLPEREGMPNMDHNTKMSSQASRFKRNQNRTPTQTPAMHNMQM
jgi:FtsP/CotA-like multicopper oxidase with cupredoxin domain